MIPRLSHFNMWLLPLAERASLKGWIFPGLRSTCSAVPARFVNRALLAIFRSERHLLSRLNLPVGASLMAVVRRDWCGGEGCPYTDAELYQAGRESWWKDSAMG